MDGFCTAGCFREDVVPTHYDHHAGMLTMGWDDDSCFGHAKAPKKPRRRVAAVKRWLVTNARFVVFLAVFGALVLYALVCTIGGTQASQDRMHRADHLRKAGQPPQRATRVAPPKLAQIERLMLDACEHTDQKCCVTARSVGEDVNAVAVTQEVNGIDLTLVMFDPVFSPGFMSSKAAISTNASEVMWVYNTVHVDYVGFDHHARAVTLQGENAYCLQHMVSALLR